MLGFHGNIEDLVRQNDNFRKVLYTGSHSQLVLMSLLPNEEIGSEVHSENDQFFRFEFGHGKVHIDENQYDIQPESVVVVPAGSRHNIINTSESELLKFYTIYSPPHHKDGLIHRTKEEAEENEQDYDGITTE